MLANFRPHGCGVFSGFDPGCWLCPSAGWRVCHGDWFWFLKERFFPLVLIAAFAYTQNEIEVVVLNRVAARPLTPEGVSKGWVPL